VLKHIPYVKDEFGDLGVTEEVEEVPQAKKASKRELQFTEPDVKAFAIESDIPF
jgi:hypothetical protein